MATTLQTLIDEVKLRYGGAPNDPFYSDTALTPLINSAIRQINLDQDWPWMQVQTTVVTTVDNNILVMPTDMRRVVKISHQWTEVQYYAERIKPYFWEQRGQPQVYSYEGTDWVVYPQPDDVYTLDVGYVLTQEPALSVPADTTLVPDWCIDSVISKTCLMMARRERDLNLEANFYGEYQNIMSKMRDEMVKTTEGMLPHRTRLEERVSQYYWGVN